MTYPYSTAATSQDARIDPAELDSFFLDDQFDEFLDRHVAAIRETLADFRNF
jgi:hypothetical protein